MMAAMDFWILLIFAVYEPVAQRQVDFCCYYFVYFFSSDFSISISLKLNARLFSIDI